MNAIEFFFYFHDPRGWSLCRHCNWYFKGRKVRPPDNPPLFFRGPLVDKCFSCLEWEKFEAACPMPQLA